MPDFTLPVTHSRSMFATFCVYFVYDFYTNNNSHLCPPKQPLPTPKSGNPDNTGQYLNTCQSTTAQWTEAWLSATVVKHTIVTDINQLAARNI